MSKENFIMHPKVDFCFKELMHIPRVRLGFISALLHVTPDAIESITTLPTILRQEHAEDKYGILDVRVMLKNGTQIDMEMQVAAFPAWEKRTLFYLCKMFTEQLHKGDSYESLKKCIHVGILDFVLFEEDEEYYSRFHIWEDSRRRQYSDELELHVLELPKLAGCHDPEDELLLWAKFFNAEKKEEFELLAKKNKYIGDAYENLIQLSADEQKRLEYEIREKNIRDHEWLMKTSHDRGFQEGENSGFSKGTASAICDLLAEFGTIPEELRKTISAQTDLKILKKWLRLAAKAESIEQFTKMIDA